jgi:hypothetical protein
MLHRADPVGPSTAGAYRVGERYSDRSGQTPLLRRKGLAYASLLTRLL